MKILVTGGAGYIGSNAVYRLIEDNHEVIIIDNLSKGYKENIHPKAKFYQYDLQNKDNLEKFFNQEKNIDVVMDFAASISVPESTTKPIEYFDNNFTTVKNLLCAMKRNNIKNIIFSSTAAVYGEPRRVPVEEDDNKDPINPYGASKLAAELFIKSFCMSKNMNYIIFRYFNVSGTNETLEVGIRDKNVSHLIPSINNLALGITKTFSIFGTDYKTRDGSCVRDYVHVVDLVDAHILGAKKLIQEDGSYVLNVSSDNGYSVKEIAESAQKILNKKLEIMHAERRAGDPATLLASNKKIKKILKWTPKYSLKDMVESDYLFRKKVFK